ncbi:MAG: c-type cytochrome [Deltaproteobacteria bacterium]|nr:c-type cytochrome [Deltaproteobacteria bacterium]
MKDRGGLNVFLLLILGGILWLTYSLGQRKDHRAVEFLPEMIYAVSAESYSRAEALPGGMVQQKPVAGTIARGRMPLHLEPGVEGAAKAAVELTNPLDESDQASLKRGGEIFLTYCQLCHGPGGKGDGLVAQRGFPAPPSLLAPQARQMSDGQLFHIASVGQGNMPGHAGQIDPLDRWRAVLRIRQLQAAAPSTETVQGEGP